MTISLHWWIVPALLAVFGVAFWIKAERASDPCFGGLFETFVALGFFGTALAVCVGHWL
jgi:cytochrome b561